MKNKYHNKKVIYDGITFDSIKEQGIDTRSPDEILRDNEVV